MKSDFFDVDRPSYNYKCLIFVEGKDDAMFIEKILTSINASSDDVRIIVCKGKAGFKTHLLLLSKSTEYRETVEVVAVALDADDSLEGGVREAHAAFRGGSMPTPRPYETIEECGRKFGLLVFPNSNVSGDLESLALELLPDGPVKEAANNLIDSLMVEQRGFKNVSKRKVQVVLAGISREIRPTVGWAFRDGTIPAVGIQSQHIVGYISLLISDTQGDHAAADQG